MTKRKWLKLLRSCKRFFRQTRLHRIMARANKIWFNPMYK